MTERGAGNRAYAGLFGVVAALALFAAPAAGAQELDEAFERDVLIIDATSACYRFDIWLAVDRDQQARGLMHVREMPATSGMLFVYEREGPRSMWMRNTYIPLDIAFARRDGYIVNIARNTEPLSEVSIRSSAPARYVLELNAGVAERLGIEPGSRLIWGPIEYDDVEAQPQEQALQLRAIAAGDSVHPDLTACRSSTAAELELARP